MTARELRRPAWQDEVCHKTVDGVYFQREGDADGHVAPYRQLRDSKVASRIIVFALRTCGRCRMCDISNLLVLDTLDAENNSLSLVTKDGPVITLTYAVCVQAALAGWFLFIAFDMSLTTS